MKSVKDIEDLKRNVKYFMQHTSSEVKELKYIGERTYGFDGMPWFMFCLFDDKTERVWCEIRSYDLYMIKTESGKGGEGE